ncbi:hypothetical protein V1460_20870 [Streptomyces sp. SCSIO 30461]|uniref:DUF6907 domain-containing protein n=1 Tax=Streptomyces sp. SCSIO 30461 TaxID=3118085 RepID=UPI0030D1D363
MSTEARTVTLAASDHGNVTLSEPTWCAGHSRHDPETQRADPIHAGPLVECIYQPGPAVRPPRALDGHAGWFRGLAADLAVGWL